MQNIRNFSIIAHVNHGKSTLSDRLIEICGGLREKEMVSQVLDSMELERERGITIKSQSVTLNYKALNGQNYQLNLIDTPGHVDFSYEVFRSLAACQGAILVIDANQGVEAQTVANYKVAKEMNLKIITVLNKVDLSTVNFSRVFEEIYEIIGINVETDAIKCSAKTGFGILRLLEHLICNIPSPTGNSKSSLQALIIDSWFDNYLGIVSLICIKNGEIKVGDKIKSINTGKKYVVEKLGIFTPKKIERKILHCGEVGWVVCSTKNIRDVFVGDTLTSVICPTKMLLPKFKKVQPYVYAGLFPTDNRYQDAFRNAIYKLSLNDASLFCEKEKSDFLGLGFRCGFLGLLHMDIIRERLKREYLLDVIITSPVVAYEVLIKNGRIVFVDSCLKFLSLKNIKEIREPIVECNVFVPKQYLGKIISLCIEKRGISIDIKYYTNQVALIYEFPMSEIILDFFDRLKSFSHGYASFNYKFKCFRTANIVCVEILINSQRVNLLSVIIHQSNVIRYCRLLVDKLKLSIPRQQFDIVIQAVVGNKVIVRATIKQLRKNVLAKCHGGDVTRKKKLLCNQKIGKKRMKKIGKVVVPNSIFLSMLNINYNKK